jgi:phospholipid-binding lipoprotein MlaA
MKTYDPWGRLNRFTYRFNARFDEALFLPVANSYRELPSPLRAGVHNFFGNVAEIDSFINYTLQGRLGRTVRSLGRFVINSTIGIGGLFDPATKLRLPKAPTGFGTTLAKWGMHPGPYLVIPFYGPSTLREGIGLAADYGTLYVIDPAWIYRGDQSWGLGVLNAVDQRANIDFRYYSSGSPFEYETIRFLYVRKELIEDAGLHRQKPLPKADPNVPAGE